MECKTSSHGTPRRFVFLGGVGDCDFKGFPHDREITITSCGSLHPARPPRRQRAPHLQSVDRFVARGSSRSHEASAPVTRGHILSTSRSKFETAYFVENAGRATKVTKTNAELASMCSRSALPVAAAAEAAPISSKLALKINATTMSSTTATSQNDCADNNTSVWLSATHLSPSLMSLAPNCGTQLMCSLPQQPFEVHGSCSASLTALPTAAANEECFKNV